MRAPWQAAASMYMSQRTYRAMVAYVRACISATYDSYSRMNISEVSRDTAPRLARAASAGQGRSATAGTRGEGSECTPLSLQLMQLLT